jgi:hypothetical protein
MYESSPKLTILFVSDRLPSKYPASPPFNLSRVSKSNFGSFFNNISGYCWNLNTGHIFVQQLEPSEFALPRWFALVVEVRDARPAESEG